MNRHENPTMKDVAREAKVSVATVSRVINGNYGVSKKLERRVQRAMEKLHYHPSSLARGFKIQETRLIGVMIPLLDHPFYSRLATAIEQELFLNDYRAIICNSDEQETRESAYLEMLLRQRADGIIINTAAQNTAYLKELEDLHIPYVLIDRNLPDAQCHKVFCDNSEGGYEGMRYLIEMGHVCIGIVAGRSEGEPVERRIQGIQRALAEAGIEDNPDLLYESDTQLFDMGYEAGKYLLSQVPRPTAIFALTDVTAVGVMHAIAELGLSIPDDISVLGYDDIEVASYVIPPLTTVAQPIVEMGQAAVKLLLENISYAEMEPIRAVLPPELIIRKSVAPPNQ